MSLSLAPSWCRIISTISKSVIGTSFLELTPQPPPALENSILSGFIAGHPTNFKNVFEDTLSKLLDLYAHPTEDLSNSTLYDRAAQFETDYTFLAPQRLFLKTASAAQRTQDVWAYSWQQHLPGSPDFFGGAYSLLI